MDVRTLRKAINQPVNMFRGVLDQNCEHIVKMSAVLGGIKNGNWKEEIEWYRQEDDKDEREKVKKQFAGITFSGTFKDRRLDKNLDSYNNVLVIDIDKKDMEMSYDKTLKCVTETPFVFCAFKSPSEGIKALAFANMGRDYHKVFFAGVEEYMLTEFGIKMDASGKNPGRLCFISYDPDLYLEFEGKRLFDLSTDAPKTHTTELSKQYDEVNTIDYSQYENTHDIRYVMEVAKARAVKGVGGYHKGNRNNFLFYLSCIFNRAGIEKDMAVDIIFQNYRSLGFDEVKRTIYSAYKHNSNEHGARPIMQMKTDQKSML